MLHSKLIGMRCSLAADLAEVVMTTTTVWVLAGEVTKTGRVWQSSRRTRTGMGSMVSAGHSNTRAKLGSAEGDHMLAVQVNVSSDKRRSHQETHRTLATTRS
jgi:hypothetical protein